MNRTVPVALQDWAWAYPSLGFACGLGYWDEDHSVLTVGFGNHCEIRLIFVQPLQNLNRGSRSADFDLLYVDPDSGAHSSVVVVDRSVSDRELLSSCYC